ncbi:MerR family transcriptional regulator [Ornithinimicrobium humiphilum]|uniref:DNA-binding transcriptional MerR regulator n=1 Tax=Ornithinimicrobium humiphilum TaxID=125288 RepID=A0A543KK34_9MICO|nr:MerR family transcriptional regulator [Ornithinimicrobium humiphilum]TQM95433.1 DNA-binding transcriptional MerR regulator [Ornithinimicrobium humiphilum]
MRIGELADATGVSARSLRYYEQEGLIEAHRDGRGWRCFDAEAVDRVILIQHLFAAGLSSSVIVELLPCLAAPPEERTSELADRLDAEIRRLEHERRHLDHELGVLTELRREAVV